jgi:hypothetical protein
MGTLIDLQASNRRERGPNKTKNNDTVLEVA